jgi:septum formation protein
MNPYPQLILASSSPYRADLLRRLGIDFTCRPPDIDEAAQAGESADHLVRRLAEAKARHVAHSHGPALVIGSDQVAVLNGRIIGKPGDHAQATAQLLAASGRRLSFLTGLCVVNGAADHAQVDVVPTTVVFRELAETEIDAYLRHERPYDCAGAFKSEGLGIALLAAIESDDPTALIGLPLIRLCEMLRAEGVDVLRET